MSRQPIKKVLERPALPSPRYLLKVPGWNHDLSIKADLNGITILKDGRFKKRYTGSKRYQVDINGQLGYNLPKPKGTPNRGQAAGQPTAAPLVEQSAAPRRVGGYLVNKREVRARLLTYLDTTPARRELYFFTITFPLQTSDDVAYRLFNTWLTSLRAEKLLKNYLWVAERQENQTVHFHMLVPHKLSVVRANRMMRTVITTAAKRGELVNYTKYQARRYNGVDIAKNRKTRKVVNFAEGRRGRRALLGYITKYVSKNNEKFNHLAWHNSRGFSQLFTGVTFTVAEFVDRLKWRPLVYPRAVVNNEYILYFPWSQGPPPLLVRELARLNSLLAA